MKVWIVGISDCESSSVICICSTKKLAEKRLFEERNRLIEEWRTYLRDDKKMYAKMIKNLSSDDYENWNNHPQDCPYICEVKVVEK